MAIAFSVLSLKRNRSNSNNKESVSKLSKLKSGFSIFSRKESDNNNRRTSFIGLFQYFRSNEDHKGTTYASDSHYEYNQYHNLKKNGQEMERNVHTLPINVAPKLTSILIKRSGTTPSSMQHIHQHPVIHRRGRTYSNATISNMTINSEDLTAKEFADIAGIRILPEEEDPRKFSQEGCSEDVVMTTISSLTHYAGLSIFDAESMSSYTSIPNNNNNNGLKIWDNEFWFHPEVTTSRSVQAQQHADLDRKLSISSIKLIEPPILHELRRMGTRNSEKDHCVIKKGRFEIQLGTDDIVDAITTNDSSTLSFSDPGVLEWKRKGKKPV